MQYPFVYLMPSMIPTLVFPTLPLDYSTSYQAMQEPCIFIKTVKNKSSEFLRLFEQELRKTSIKYIKKVWTKQDDHLLMNLKKQNLRWTQISLRIPNSNPQTCKRRYFRIIEDEKKWPQDLEQQIKKVCTLQQVKWQQKLNILYQRFPDIKNYSKKMIKERYLTYLQQNIDQRPWTIEQDMLLIRLLEKGNKKWREIAHLIPGRTQLHLKNRYYGCLRSIEQKVQNILKQKN